MLSHPKSHPTLIPGREGVLAQALAPRYDGLAHVDEVVPFDPARDGAVFDRLAMRLVTRKAHDTFGLCLLHTHFDLDDGEIVWERIDRATNTLHTEVRDLEAALADGGRPTSWRCVAGAWAPLTFGRHGLAAEALAEAAPLFVDLAEILVGMEACDRFGLTLNGAGVRARPFRIHVERTDEAGRRQMLAPEWAPLRSRSRDLDTSWTVRPSVLSRLGIVRATGTRCKTRCKTTCVVGTVHGPWHSGKEHTGEKF